MRKFFEGRKPDYETPDRNIAFFSNPNDGPHAYDIIVRGGDMGEYHFYIHDRIIDDIASPHHSTKDIMRSLEALTSGEAEFILRECKISPEQLHIALLQLRIVEQEQELEHALEHMRT